MNERHISHAMKPEITSKTINTFNGGSSVELNTSTNSPSVTVPAMGTRVATTERMASVRLPAAACETLVSANNNPSACNFRAVATNMGMEKITAVSQSAALSH